MNSNTKEKLEKFIDAMETLTAGVVLQIGVQSAAEILTACTQLKQALNQELPPPHPGSPLTN